MKKINIIILLLISICCYSYASEEIYYSDSTIVHASIYFEKDIDKAQKTELKKLKPIIKLFLDNPQRKMIIYGYTDSRGSVSGNEHFSYLRAMNISRHLTSNGIKNSQISIMGLGIDTIASNDKEARRVDIIEVLGDEIQYITETKTEVDTIIERVVDTIVGKEYERVIDTVTITVVDTVVERVVDTVIKIENVVGKGTEKVVERIVDTVTVTVVDTVVERIVDTVIKIEKIVERIELPADSSNMNTNMYPVRRVRLNEDGRTPPRRPQTPERNMPNRQRRKKGYLPKSARTPSYYVGIGGGISFANASLSSFAQNANTGGNVSIIGGIKANTNISAVSAEASLNYTRVNMAHNSKIDNSVIIIKPDGSAVNFNYSDLFANANIISLGIKANIDIVALFKHKKPWMAMISPKTSINYSNLQLATKDIHIKTDNEMHLGIGADFSGQYMFKKKYGLRLTTGFEYLIGKNIGLLPKSASKNNYIWNTSIMMIYRF